MTITQLLMESSLITTQSSKNHHDRHRNSLSKMATSSLMLLIRFSEQRRAGLS